MDFCNRTLIETKEDLAMQKTKLNRKGALGLGDIYPAVLTFVLIGIILGIGLYVLSKIATQVGGNDTKQWGAVNTTIVSLSTFADWFGIIIIVLAAAIIIGLVMRSFRQ